MKNNQVSGWLVLGALLTGCGRPPAPPSVAPPQHEHQPPHGGTPVVLGNEEYHLELVLEAPAGRLTAYVLDGELEKYVRLKVPSFTVQATIPAGVRTLEFQGVANSATGETHGDSAQFEAQADWLKVTTRFDAVLPSLVIRTRTYTNVAFNFPNGNEVEEASRK